MYLIRQYNTQRIVNIFVEYLKYLEIIILKIT